MKTMIDDDTLLQRFFAEHQQHVADNGFTERVMAILPAREDETVLILRRWRVIFDTIAALCAITVLVILGIHLWNEMQTATFHIMNGGLMIIHNMSELLDPDNLLVQMLRFLHRLTQWLPSPIQLLALFLTTLILLPITVKAALRD